MNFSSSSIPKVQSKTYNRKLSIMLLILMRNKDKIITPLHLHYLSDIIIKEIDNTTGGVSH